MELEWKSYQVSTSLNWQIWHHLETDEKKLIWNRSNLVYYWTYNENSAVITFVFSNQNEYV